MTDDQCSNASNGQAAHKGVINAWDILSDAEIHDLAVRVREKLDSATDPVVKTYYGILLKLNLEISRQRVDVVKPKLTARLMDSLISHAFEHYDRFDDQQHANIRFTISSMFFFARGAIPMFASDLKVRKEYKKQLLKHLDPANFDKLFRLAHMDAYVHELEEAISTRIVPVEMVHAYQKWKQKNQGWIYGHAKSVTADTPADAVPEVVIASEPEEFSGVTYINVNHALVVADGHDNMGYEDYEAELSSVRPQEDPVDLKRWKLLVKTFLADNIPASAITVRLDARKLNPENPQTPYDLVDIKTDTLDSRIAVPRLKGYATFVIRDPQPLGEHDMISVAALRDDPKVWTVRYNSQEQWLGGIQKLVATPLDKLEPELKHRTYWCGRKETLIQSFIATIVHTGKLPGRGDKSEIKHGPLTGKTTFSRAYAGLQNGHIKGLEGIRTFKQLYKALLETNPWLDEFLDKPPVSAVDVFNDCSGFIREFDLVPEPAFYDSFTIGGRTPGAVAKAFQIGAVQGVKEYIGDDQPKPRTIEDFIVAAGLAEKSGTQLVPA